MNCTINEKIPHIVLSHMIRELLRNTKSKINYYKIIIVFNDIIILCSYVIRCHKDVTPVLLSQSNKRVTERNSWTINFGV